ncbi:MAG: NUDIX hydrolase [Polyangiaceae bacterium]|nr:NUDIX hydrolase [Polyangiaceae bacterium]
MAIARGVWGIIKEVGRHVLRRPVVGILAAARTPDGRWVLIRRGDTGLWALPGGTLEWGETLRTSIERELFEETGCRVLRLGTLAGVYSDPARDFRFHAVTVVVYADVSTPECAPMNALEVKEVSLFETDALPNNLSHGMSDILEHARSGRVTWE